jgi:hypothetical protein
MPLRLMIESSSMPSVLGSPAGQANFPDRMFSALALGLL